jgi:phospholipase C
MIMYIDSVQRAKSTSASLTAILSLPAGKHAIVIRAWDTTGFAFATSESITVAVPAPTPTPTPTPTATPTPTPTATPTPTPTPTPGGGITAVGHIIFVLQENRSFDSYFGMLNPYRKAQGFNIGDDHVEYDVDGIDDKLTTLSNKNDEGTAFQLFHTSSSCLDDMTSAWLESFGDVNRFDFKTTRSILMDGFVHTAEGFAKSGSGSGVFTDTAGERAMAFYEDTSTTGAAELNYYYFMASQFALSDRWFSPVASKTIPNRLATMSGGTTQGYVFDPGFDDHAPQLNAKTIFQLLDENHISWKIYYSALDPNGSPSTTFKYFGYSGKYISRTSTGTLVVDATHIAPISQFATDAKNNTLPSFAYVEANFGHSDEHPGSGQSILVGQAQIANLINSLMASPSWSDSVLFFSYDEGGGPFDHVPPVPGHTNQNTSASLAGLEGDIAPIAVNPDGFLPCQPTTPGVFTNHCDLRPTSPGANPADAANAGNSGFGAQLGFRVPNFIVSPFSRRHFVGHKAMDHTAVIHFVEERFNLPALTKRDAAQPSLVDFFDFAGKPWATPPTGVPTPPGVGSTCHPATMK